MVRFASVRAVQKRFHLSFVQDRGNFLNLLAGGFPYRLLFNQFPHELAVRSASEDFVDGDTEDFRELLQLGNVRHTDASFPVGDRLKADPQPVRQPGLRDTDRFSQLGNTASYLLHIKHFISAFRFRLCE